MKRKRGLPTYPGSRNLHIKLTLLIILEAVSIVAQATFLARAIVLLFDRIPVTEVFIEILFFVIAFMVRYGLNQIQIYLAENYAEKTSTKLRSELMSAYFTNRAQTLQNEGTARLVTLAIDGVDQLKAYLEIISLRTLKTIIIPITTLIIIYLYDFISAVILVITVPVVIIFMILLGKAAQKQADKQYETYRLLSNHFVDSLKGLITLSYLGKSKEHKVKIKEVSESYRKATMKTLSFAFLSSFALDFFTSLSIAFVAVGLGLRLIDGTIILLPALTILILAPEYYSPIKQIGKDFHATLDGQLAMQDIDQFIDQSRALTINYSKELTWQSNSLVNLSLVNYKIGDVSLLKDITIKLPEKGLIGLIGTSGAGKSTLINVLAGRTEITHGKIEVNNKETETLHDEAWFANIAYIPQHPYIFPASIFDNIRFYEPLASRDSVQKVIEQIGLNEFVNELPEGMDELIGESGRSLSGGQEQRIAMARALLSDKPIILLDEPTAHLDIETEYDIKKVILELFKDKLLIIATHRLHWMQNLDYIYMLEKGEIIAEGKDTDLLKTSEAYQLLNNRKRRS
ncbi:MAG TPA: thiol reductant ABC exporter subunit CydD [Pseudogracilibacillus sp.]|nr:thiol reductant ABC exporter subunit CydD [Pseudogracilibacillus sp.]